MPVKHALPLPPWLQTDWQHLCEYQKSDRIPQALLIAGAQGIGKALLAKQFAVSLLCLNPDVNGNPCYQCRSCKLIDAGNHPDFVEIFPEEDKNSISINQIRTVLSVITLKPQFERYRIILVMPADLMTISAANAFLKCLEEPPERTVFVLTTDKPHKLPATIASRCQRWVLNSPDPASFRQWLTKNGVDHNRLPFVNLLKGGLLKPLKLADDVLLRQREACFNDWLLLAEYKAYPGVVSEKWDEVPKVELLNWLISWVSDTIKCLFVSDDGFFYNLDFVKALQKKSQELELSCLYSLFDHLLDCRQQVTMQINFQMMLEEILVRWQQLNRRNSYG